MDNVHRVSSPVLRVYLKTGVAFCERESGCRAVRLTFRCTTRYVQGMIIVKNDPDLSQVLPMDVPNRFQQLSLLIDPPVNKEREDEIKRKLGCLERCGVKVLEKMRSKKMERHEIRHALDQACAGKLHYLTDDQRKRVNRLHLSCVFQAFLIAMVTCGM